MATNPNWGSLAWSNQYLNGARDMLLALRDHWAIEDNTHKRLTKQERVINKATVDFLLSDKWNIDRYIKGDELEFYDWNEKGTECKVRFREK